MKKLGRRTLGVIVGLMLGWYCAGLAGDLLPGVATVHASSATTVAAAEAVTMTGLAAEGELDRGQQTAANLLPSDEQIPFYRPVLMAAGGLFVLAIAIGILLRSFGVKDPGAAAIEYDQAHAHH